MRNLMLLVFVLFCTKNTYSQEKFKVHIIKEGEDLDYIIKIYDCPKEEIARLNPDLVIDSIKVRDILIIKDHRIGGESLLTKKYKKKKKEKFADVVENGFIIHKVRKKETKYGICKKYRIPIKDFIDNNPHTISGLKYKDIVKIPLNNKNKFIFNSIKRRNLKKYNIHIIEKGEGIWRVCYNYNISKEDLSNLNPFINERFNVGDTLLIPKIKRNKSKKNDDNFIYYEVKQRDSKFSISKKMDIPISEIERLNPKSKFSLNIEDILKLPKNKSNNIIKNKKVYGNEINIAVMLPFYLNKNINEINKINIDSINIYTKTNIGLDFYFGIIQAIETFKVKNIDKKINIKVFDTENNINKIQNILENNNFDNMDFIVGPLYTRNVEFLAKNIDNKDIPIISPLSNKHTFTSLNNIIQITPTDFISQNKILNKLISEYSNQNIVVSGSIYDINKVDFIKNKLSNTLPLKSEKINYVIQKGETIVLDSIKHHMDTTRSNIIIIPTKDIIFTSSLVSLANYFNNKEKGIFNKVYYLETLNTKNYRKLISSMPVDYFTETNFIYPTNYFVEENSSKIKSFQKKYLNINNKFPNKYSFLGYDIIGFCLDKVSKGKSMFDEENEVYKGLTNQFKLNKKISSSYYNSEVLLIRFSKMGIPYVVQ